MCGIVGFIDETPKKEKKLIIKKMASLLKHRGPDGEGYFVDDDIAIGHRRLAILDIKGGKQPMVNKQKTLILSFNGEIYNYQELKKELQQAGYKFETTTDSEVILNGYDYWQEKICEKLRGMFAFVIYDRKKKILFGARDCFGMKPFYYSWTSQYFLFASEIKAFLNYPNFEKEVNKDALKMYLMMQFSAKEETFFKNVFKLPPGHFFYYQNNHFQLTKYFNYEFQRTTKYQEGTCRKLKKAIDDSINLHKTTSDVEVGSYLSGGVDSSYVVSVLKPKHTFSVGFKMDGFDETELAQDLSQKLAITNHSLKITPDDFFASLPKIMYYTDEPHANLSTIPLYFLSKMTKDYVKVVLSGEGADEMFGGYNEYCDPLLLQLYLKVPLTIRKKIRQVCQHLPHFKGRNTLIKYGLSFDERYFGHGTFMESEEANRLLAPDLRNDETPKDLFKDIYEKVKNEDELTKKMYFDYYYWLPQDILLKADKMSMANSVELRTPFLDKEVYNVVRTLPLKMLVRDKTTKYLFRKIAEDNLPKEWSSRRKCGFPVPFSKWLLEEKYYKMVKKTFSAPFVSDFFDKDYINELLDKHFQKQENNGREIYNVYCFLVWYQVYFQKEWNYDFV